MEKIVDLIATDASPADTTDQIKDLLYTKAAAKIEDLRKSVADSMFDETEVEQEEEPNGE
ncbi:MAG: hypothetical protein CM15mV9_0870 [uncultured marine virus]|jgi:hypothetical protein|nr:MAG: hypothetical protein CM15mV9_0870 [uncultured marine virus]|tara:strand:+ start:485 stop:664 length:180 start_codon:yes stop_codon:yes gene_type:complete